ncbi:unnamed protein product [Polarella glacialis]|uniref:Amidohydrolase-related domain-containing protein n=1 Tax=Polarella glacialis TaxID=89957 RepID=A0A813FY11_POLGL|nr:unnamed protein product [Polarella glacialis]
MDVDEVVSAAWVVPVETSEVLQDHSVVISGSKIVDILPTAQVEAKYRPKKHTKLPNAALTPGFINTHTHTPMVYLRGVSDDIPLREWLEGTIWPLEFKLVSHDFVKDGAKLAILEMIMGGITTFNDMYWYPEAVCEAVVSSGVRAAVGMIAIEFPFGSYGTGPDDYLAKGQATMEKFKAEERLSWCVALHAPYTCSDATITKGGDLSKKLNVPLHIHLHESSDEVEASAAGNKDNPSCHMSSEKCRPMANLERLGVLNERLIAVHMNWLTDEEVAQCATSGASIVHCPCSGMKLASGFCRVHDLLEAGVNVALGTDGASSNNSLDMMAEMKLAALLAKGVAKNAQAAPAATALRMATLNGAKALGLGEVTGSLKVGKFADMVAIEFNVPGAWPAPVVTGNNGMPGFDPVTHIVYSSTRDQVSDVWVHGQRLMSSRQVLTMDSVEIREAADKWSAKIQDILTELAASKRQKTEN